MWGWGEDSTHESKNGDAGWEQKARLTVTSHSGMESWAKVRVGNPDLMLRPSFTSGLGCAVGLEAKASGIESTFISPSPTHGLALSRDCEKSGHFWSPGTGPVSSR